MQSTIFSTPVIQSGPDMTWFIVYLAVGCIVYLACAILLIIREEGKDCQWWLQLAALFLGSIVVWPMPLIIFFIANYLLSTKDRHDDTTD